MIVNVLCLRRYSKRKIKSKVSQILSVNNHEWVDGEYLFDNNILYHVRNRWISFQSLDETTMTYSTIRKCLDLLFDNSSIKMYGNYDSEQLM